MKLKSFKVRTRGFSPAENIVALQAELNKPETRERAKLETAFWQAVRDLEPLIFGDWEHPGRKVDSDRAISAAGIPEFIAGLSRDVRMFVETVRSLPLEIAPKEGGGLAWGFSGLASLTEGQVAKTASQFLPAATVERPAAQTAATVPPPSSQPAVQAVPATEPVTPEGESGLPDAEQPQPIEFLSEEEE